MTPEGPVSKPIETTSCLTSVRLQEGGVSDEQEQRGNGEWGTLQLEPRLTGQFYPSAERSM